jgi:lactoylglutathione lyase
MWNSVKFYSFLGLSQVNKLSFPDNKFDLYFLAYDGPTALSKGVHWTARPGILELTHNYGSESDPNFKVNNGNVEPHRGFGHIAISVDNIQAACKRIEDEGYEFQKKLTDGRMRHIAFVKDPDGRLRAKRHAWDGAELRNRLLGGDHPTTIDRRDGRGDRD